MLLQLIADETWAATRRLGLAETCCIAATAMASRVCDYYGIRNRPQPVTTVVVNAAAYAAAERGEPMEQWPREAWMVQADTFDPSKVGHLVLLAETDGLTCIVDASAPQFARPARGITTTPLAVPAPPGWPADGKAVMFGGPDGTKITYTPALNDRYRSSPDWRGGDRRCRREIGAVIRAVRSAQ